ncbi:MAG: hypothetical protein JMDDDDMK_01481 [Acidobacteria bacterium]|nr:hypothetical protein [Acidobacteriota bacterium]
MAARDFYHEHVRTALTKDGWTITDDPLSVKWLGTTLQVDLGAERIIAAEKGAEKIAVEVKSFISPSIIEDLKDALGQFLIYRASLKIYEPERRVFLALRHDVYDNTFGLDDGEMLLLDEKINLVIFDADREEIVKWIS